MSTRSWGTIELRAAGSRALAALALLALGSCTPPEPRPWIGQVPPAPAVTSEVPPGRPASATAAPTPLAQPTPPPLQPIIQRGTGVFVNPQPAPRATAEISDDDEVTLSFVNADVREVVGVVLGDILGRNYLVSPAVGGTVTIQTREPIPREAVLELFDQALRLTGATLVARDGVLEVIPQEIAMQTGAGVEIGPRQRARIPGFGIEILPLEYVGTAQMLQILQPALLPDTFVHPAAERNVLIVAGGSEQRRMVADLVQLFDVDWLRGRSVGLFPLEFAQAEAISTELRAIFGASEEDPAADVIRFTPVERLNAVLAISTQDRYLDRAAQWIERLDRGLGETSPQVFVYNVQNKRAADLAEVLTLIFAPGTALIEPRAEVAPGREPVTLLGAPRAGREPTGLLGGRRTGRVDLGTAAAAEPIQREIGTPRVGPSPLDVEEPVVEPGVAPPAVPAPPGVIEAPDEVLVPTEAEIRIIADESSNALVVLATPRDYRRVEAALRQLDVIPLQVLIEATIAEVTLNDNLRYGLQWFFESGDFAVRLGDTVAGRLNPVLAGFSAVFDGPDARVILDAVASVADLNVISAPQVLVLDNQTAVLQVGDQVPVPVRQAVPIDVGVDERSVVSSIEFRDTGTILLVTPRVNASGLVTLEIEQEVSDAVQTRSSTIDAPTIQRRLIQTTVAVDSGETLALGGLIRDRTNRVRSGVPLLMEIPILGGLFRRTADEQDRSEILVLITPRVIRNAADGRAVTQELRQRLSTLAPLEERVRGPAPLPPVLRPGPAALPPAPAPVLRPAPAPVPLLREEPPPLPPEPAPRSG